MVWGLFSNAFGQQYSEADDSAAVSLQIYPGGTPIPPVQYVTKSYKKAKKPKNVILLIGDGMGLSHVFAARVANGGSLYLDQFSDIGLHTTHSESSFITDSGAGGTALSTGVKTYNGAIGVINDSTPLINLSEMMSVAGKSTGVISTSSVTHATPATFVAHRPDREQHEEIALDFVESGIDLFIGGGVQYFCHRSDSADLIQRLRNLNYLVDTQTVLPSPTSINLEILKPGQKFAGMYAEGHMPSVDSGRSATFLAEATGKAINMLSRNKEGYFLMVEGSQIDWGGHDNNTTYIVTEMLDFDRAVGEALRYATKDGETLVIVTADHETGGFAVHDGDYTTGSVTGKFTTSGHTGVWVPVFAFGPGSEHFRGIHDNTDIPRLITEVMKIDWEVRSPKFRKSLF